MSNIKREKSRSGAAMVMTAVLATVIIGVTALVVDIGYIYYKSNEVQTAVNAGWLAGNDRLLKLKEKNPVIDNEAEKSIRDHVIEVMAYNGFKEEDGNRISFNIENNRNLRLSAKSHLGLFFARVIDIDSTTVSVSREAYDDEFSIPDVLPLVMAHGVAKWNSDNSLSFQFFPKNEGFVIDGEYIIKPGQMSEYSLICQGITDFSKEASLTAEEYKKGLKYGLIKSLNVNDELGLVCGGFPSETENLINERLNGSGRRVIIPLVEVTRETAMAYAVSTSSLPIYSLRADISAKEADGVKSISNAVKIIGFAEFELLSVREYKKTELSVQQGGSEPLGTPASGQIRGKFLGYIVNPNEVL